MKKESPALQMMSAALSGNVSARRSGYAIDHAVKAAIYAHLRFDPDDIKSLRPGRLLNQGVGDDWYRLAIDQKHPSAMTAVEHFLEQPRFVCNGEVLHVGHTFKWPGAVTEDNPAGWVTVLSFAPDGQSVKCRAAGGDQRRQRAECAVCGSTLYDEKPKDTTVRPFYTIQRRALVATERARKAILEMSFEAKDGECLREYTGVNLAAEWRERNLLALAKLKVGDSIAVDDRGTLTRIAFRTHDALAMVGASEGRGRGPHGYSYERREYTGEIEAQVQRLVDAGLATSRDEEHRHDGRLLYTQVHVTLTEAGRARLIALTPTGNLRAVEHAGLDRLLSSYTDRQLAVVVRVADSRSAGNCRTGTREWIEKHAKGRTEMTVRELVGLDGDDWNVKAAIRQALRRVGLERDEKEPSVVVRDAQPFATDEED